MGGAKRMMEEEETRRNVALDVALAAGALKRCLMHEDSYLEGNEDVDAAYRLGNHRFSNGDFEGLFSTRREMTDSIQSVVEDLAADECGACANWRDS